MVAGWGVITTIVANLTNKVTRRKFGTSRAPVYFGSGLAECLSYSTQ